MPAKLYFYYSAMNAGKSATLLQSNHNYHERGMGTLLFIPALMGTDRIRSRIGLEAPAHAFAKDFDFYAHVAEHQRAAKEGAPPCACILVDEAQFLTKAQVRQLTCVADELQVPVLCYGLRSDFQGEPFEGAKYLMTWADALCEIKTICHCGRKATMNQRVAADGSVVAQGAQVQVGGNESYVGKCRCHFWRGLEEAERQAGDSCASTSAAGSSDGRSPQRPGAPPLSDGGSTQRSSASSGREEGCKRPFADALGVAEPAGAAA